MRDLNEVFCNIIGNENVFANEDMSKRTTFKAGGRADYFLLPANTNELQKILSTCEQLKTPYTVLGAGSNVLVADEGFRGAIVCTKRLNEIILTNGLIQCGAGAMLSTVANFALKNSVTGLEFLSGIPGTVGGAIFMNAGAYGREISDVFKNAETLSKKDAAWQTLSHEDMRFSYRSSVIQSTDYIVGTATLVAEKGEQSQIKAKITELNAKRAEKQPLDLPSAGSAFKRPSNGYAAQMIEEAGLKGFTIGGAAVSQKHAGFIVNLGAASAADILDVAKHVQKTVYEKFGVTLEREFLVLGEQL